MLSLTQSLSRLLPLNKVCFCVSIARLRIEDAFDDTHVAGCNTADVVECVVFPAAPDVSLVGLNTNQCYLTSHAVLANDCQPSLPGQ